MMRIAPALPGYARLLFTHRVQLPQVVCRRPGHRDSQQAGVHGIVIFFLDWTNPEAPAAFRPMQMMSRARAFDAFPSLRAPSGLQ